MGSANRFQSLTNVQPSQVLTQFERGSVAVIGAGVIGLTTALNLQQQGFQVTLIDAEGVAAGASFGNAGHIATEQVFPLASTGLLWQLPTLLRQGTLALRWSALWSERRFFWRFLTSMCPSTWLQSHRVLRQLCTQAMPAWQRLLAQYQLSDFIQTRGNVLVFEGPDAEKNAAEQQQSYASAGVACRVLSQQQTAALCPGLSSIVRCSLYFEQTGHCISPGLLCQRLAQAFCDAGGTIQLDRVTALQPTDGVVVALASGAAVRYRQVVLCTGAASNPLLRPLGINLPLTAERGYHQHVQLSEQPKLAVASFDRKMILTPMVDGLRICGLVEFAGVGAQPDWRHLQGLQTHAKALWPALAQQTGQCSTQWSGERPTIADSLPVVGDSGVAGIWLNLGHQHLGLTFAAYSAELLLGAMLGNAAVNLLPALSCQRFK